MAKKIKSTKTADVWYTKDRQGIEKWTVIEHGESFEFDNELEALLTLNPNLPLLNIVAIDQQVMLRPRKSIWNEPGLDDGDSNFE
jgi:hypothetical protein